jgi:hypothetical protein
VDAFLKMDVFFVVATAGFVVLGALAALVLVRVNRILANIEHVTEQAALESDHLREDLAELREDIREGGSRIGSALAFFGRVHKRHARKR